MSEENIFSSDQEPEIVANPAPIADALPPEVAELVGEGKKYKSAQDALKSIPHAQSHIQRLEEELAATKAEVAKAKAVDELLEELRKQPPQSTPAQAATPQEPLDINGAVEAALARKEAQLTAKANAKTVIDSFKQAYGEQSEAQFIKLAEETGLAIPYLNNLAMTSPSAVLKLAGLTKSAQPNVPHSSSTVNTQAALDNNKTLSSAVPVVGASSKDVLQAWRNAGEFVKQKLS